MIVLDTVYNVLDTETVKKTISRILIIFVNILFMTCGT